MYDIFVCWSLDAAHNNEKSEIKGCAAAFDGNLNGHQLHSRHVWTKDGDIKKAFCGL